MFPLLATLARYASVTPVGLSGNQPWRRATCQLRREVTPHFLVALRIALAAAIAALLTVGREAAGSYALAFALFALGVGTDVADGFLARRQGTASSLGAFLDPLADKLLVLAALIPVIVWSTGAAALVGVLAVRDLSMVVFRARLLARGVALPASGLSKLKTALLYGACAMLLLGMASFAQLAVALGMGLLAAGTFVSIASALKYAAALRRRHA